MSRTEKTLCVCLLLLFWAGVALRAWQNHRTKAEFYVQSGSSRIFSGPSAGPRQERMDLNRASLSDIESLPGLGPKLAQSVIDYRTRNGPFKKVGELSNIHGFGPSRLKRLEPYLHVSSGTP